MSKIRLVDALICMDCDCLYSEENYDYCPACGSAQNIRLTKIVRPMNPILKEEI